MLTLSIISGMIVHIDTTATVSDAIYHTYQKESKRPNFTSTLSKQFLCKMG